MGHLVIEGDQVGQGGPAFTQMQLLASPVWTQSGCETPFEPLVMSF